MIPDWTPVLIAFPGAPQVPSGTQLRLCVGCILPHEASCGGFLVRLHGMYSPRQKFVGCVSGGRTAPPCHLTTRRLVSRRHMASSFDSTHLRCALSRGPGAEPWDGAVMRSGRRSHIPQTSVQECTSKRCLRLLPRRSVRLVKHNT